VKAQVHTGGRGKAGGVKLAKDSAELEEHASAILGMDIRGFTVHELYIEKASDIDEEYYAAILLDRGWSKAAQPHTGEDDKDIHVTIRNIVEGRR